MGGREGGGEVREGGREECNEVMQFNAMSVLGAWLHLTRLSTMAYCTMRIVCL